MIDDLLDNRQSIWASVRLISGNQALSRTHSLIDSAANDFGIMVIFTFAVAVADHRLEIGKEQKSEKKRKKGDFVEIIVGRSA